MEYYRKKFGDALEDSDDVQILGVTWKASYIIEKLDDGEASEIYAGWVSQEITASKDRVRDFLDQNGCRPRFDRLYHIHGNSNIVPFVGAGMSKASGFPLWGEFLRSLVADAAELQPDVDALLGEWKFEETAQLIFDRLGERVLAEEIQNQMGEHRTVVDGPVQLLPNLFDGEVLTTNFDYVLSNVFRGADKQFSGEHCGVSLKNVIGRIANDPRRLLRLHGEAAF